MFSLAMFDVILPKVQRFMGGSEPKRYAMVPGVDMFNHNAVKAGKSQVEFRYFTNSFDVLSASDYAIDEEVYISYGAQSNDAFLQYYSFIEEDNPADDFVFDQQISNELGLGDGQLVVQRNGFSAKVVRAVQKRIGGDREKAIALLRKMCALQIDLFGSSVDDDTDLLQTNNVKDSHRASLAIRYRRSKKLLLQKIVDEWEIKG